MLDSRTRPNQLLRLGFVADGCFKLVVAACLPAVASRIGSSPGLGLTASIAVAASAAREIDVGVRSGSSCRPRYLAAYDSGWLAATAVAVALAQWERVQAAASDAMIAAGGSVTHQIGRASCRERV